MLEMLGEWPYPMERPWPTGRLPGMRGIGWLPTEDGQRLIEFLRRHLGIEFEEETTD